MHAKPLLQAINDQPSCISCILLFFSILYFCSNAFLFNFLPANFSLCAVACLTSLGLCSGWVGKLVVLPCTVQCDSIFYPFLGKWLGWSPSTYFPGTSRRLQFLETGVFLFSSVGVKPSRGICKERWIPNGCGSAIAHHTRHPVSWLVSSVWEVNQWLPLIWESKYILECQQWTICARSLFALPWILWNLQPTAEKLRTDHLLTLAENTSQFPFCFAAVASCDTIAFP